MLSSPAAASVDLCRLEDDHRRLGAAAAARPAALERGIDVFTGYGMSETCPILTLCAPAAEDARRAGRGERQYRCRAGRPLPLVELRIVDAQMNDVAHDGASRRDRRARAVADAGLSRATPKQSEELWRGGYLHTGDVGVIDADGYVQITDRIKDVIKTGGEWVSSLDLEDLILRMSRRCRGGRDRHARRALGRASGGPGGRQAGTGRAADRGRDPAPRRPLRERGASPNTQCRIACISSTPFPKTSVGKLDKKVIRANLRTRPRREMNRRRRPHR